MGTHDISHLYSILYDFKDSVLKELVSIKEVLAIKNDIPLENLQKAAQSTIQTTKKIEEKVLSDKNATNTSHGLPDNEWKIVSGKKAGNQVTVKKTDNTWITENPFQNLQFVNNQDTGIDSRNFQGFEDDYEPSICTDSYPLLNEQVSDDSFKSYPVLSHSKRPTIVTTENPENDDPAKYRRAKSAPIGPKNVTMVVDSMVKFRVRDFNQDIKDYGIQNVKCKIHKFPAATAEQISEYTPSNVRRNKADGLVIHAGTNSLGVKDGDGNLLWTDEEIAEQIADIAFRARKDGVRKIFISSLIVRRGRFFNERITNINSLLHEICHQNDFIYISHCNINFSHLEDALHLTDEGLSVLSENFLQALY